MVQKIAVLALTGFLGAGKTTLLNRLLGQVGTAASGAPGAGLVDPARAVVLVNEVGEIGLDHHLIRHVNDRVVVLASGCICCSVKGELVNTLRDLFMAAVQRKIKPFSHVVIETTGIADPSSIRYTLAFERFLADRYRYAGCVTLVDTPLVQEQYDRHPEVQSQLAMADGLVLSKIDQCAGDTVQAADDWLARLCPQARRVRADALHDLAGLFALGAASAGKGGLFGLQGKPLGPLLATRHGQLEVVSERWPGAVSKPALVKALAAALDQAGSTLLRFKGIFLLENGERVVVHAVHGTAYPPELLGEGANSEGLPDCALVAITRGSSAQAFLDFLRVALGELL